jgi:hypothetical protein
VHVFEVGSWQTSPVLHVVTVGAGGQLLSDDAATALLISPAVPIMNVKTNKPIPILFISSSPPFLKISLVILCFTSDSLVKKLLNKIFKLKNINVLLNFENKVK